MVILFFITLLNQPHSGMCGSLSFQLPYGIDGAPGL